MNARQAALVTYYFHGTARCPICLKMEQYAREAIQEAFAAERTAGLIEWRAVNYDEHENEHYLRDFGLTASALVVVGGSSTTSPNWRVLDHVREL